jgi:two-component system response regulator RegX3
VRLLLVEDDDSIAIPLVRGLERERFDVTRVVSGGAALDAPLPDLFLLDLGLPDMDGYEVCRKIRATSDVPIIVITARGDEVDRVIGLELGADDYLVKPFGFRELVARIRAVSRRSDRSPSAEPPREVMTCGPLTIDLRARRAQVDDTELELTRKEFDLLALLAREQGAAVRREQILREVWDTHWYGPTKTLDVHIGSLRKKLGHPGLIETVRGVGFRLDESATEHSPAPPP